MSNIVIPNDIFFENLLDELSTSGSVLLTVKGWSMFPFFKNEKDAVLLRPFDPSAGLAKGDVALFRYKGKYILHRCTGWGMRSGSAVYIFRGDGNVRGQEYASADEVFAVVEKKIAPSGKEWSCNSFSWKLCSRLWPSAYLLRRLFLGVLRRIPFFR